MTARHFGKSTTRLRLIASVIGASLLPMILLASVSISRQRQVATDNAYASLEGIATAQVGYLESLATADRELAEALANNPQLVIELAGHNRIRGVDIARLNAILRSTQESSSRIVNISVHATDQSIVAAIAPRSFGRYDQAGLDVVGRRYNSRIIATGEGGLSAVTNTPVLRGDETIGAVVVETDASEIVELATDYAGLSATGETSLAQVVPTGAQLISPLRFRNTTPLEVIVPRTLDQAPISLAMAGKQGRFGSSVDYRNVEVLAVTRFVEDTGWGVVVKIDRAEALASVDHFQRTVAGTLAIAVLLALMISMAVGKGIWRPVHEVTAAATAVAGGDRRRRADVDRNDELGDLANAVNTMTDELVRSETQHAQRLAELENLNALLVTSEEQLSNQALHDGLTGLANRANLRNQLDSALQNAEAVAVLFIDLDRFKLVNDSRGHAAGDDLLLQVAGRLKATVLASDSVARFGGDEFVVLSRDTTPRGAHLLAEQLRDKLEQPFEVDGEPEHIGASIGVAMASTSSTSDSLISDADVAMYRAKALGRNRSVIFDAEMRDWVEERHELESALRHAIDAREMTVAYQPIVDLTTGEISGLEALSRWDRPGHGPVSPEAFINVAEESGLIVPIGRAVFRQVCEQQVAWSKSHPDVHLRLTVNMSAREVGQADCFDAIARIVGQTGAQPSRITLELTETALSSDLDTAVRNLEQLRRLGFMIAIDDFGTGYSSLTYLRQLPIDVVKIDRSFMTELERESPESSIVGLVIGLGHNLGIDVVAEGVETEAQLAALRDLRCQYAQGYLFARPQPPEEVELLLWPEFDANRLAAFNMASTPPPTE